MKRVLVVDPYELLGQAVQKGLAGECEVKICTSGADVLYQIRLWEPDLVMMDFELVDMDAMSILRAIYTSGSSANILMITNGEDEYSLCQMDRFGVGSVITIPCTTELVLDQIRSLLNRDERNWLDGWCVENEIEQMLMVLHFRRGPSRYRCVFEAILMRYHNPDYAMKELYIDVAKICGGNYQRVEKAIRNAISDAYACSNKSLWDYYFIKDPRREKPYPSNEDFIASVAGLLRQHERIERRRLQQEKQAE